MEIRETDITHKHRVMLDEMPHDVSTPFLQLEHVYVARGDNIVLQDFSLHVQAGEHIAILGPNGCGKSTLIKAITCECYPLVRPETVLRIFGRERWDVNELRKRLGVVGAELPGRQTRKTTGLDAVISGYFSSSAIWPNLHATPEMRARASAVLEQLEAMHLAGKLVGEMSAGEQRRVMIGRALVHAPEMLLLDEPSNALDLFAQQELRETLRRLARQGIGIIMVTHHLPDVIPEVERVVMLRDGRLFADGAKADLLTAPRLQALFGTTVELHQRDGYYHVG
jgi:iron complex transport system ATP-binding protein